MKFLVAVLALTGCGYSSRGSEVVGQVKKVAAHTPIVCPERTDVDLSLGVMRNGVGSMSNEDQWFYVPDVVMGATLKRAAEEGLLVRATYDVERFVLCHPDHILRTVEVISD